MRSGRPAPGRPKPDAAPLGGGEGAKRQARGRTIWLFDLDNTLHNASASSFRMIDGRMTDYMVRELGIEARQANTLRADYLHRYGATLLGLVRHHGVRPAHFLHVTHELPGLEAQLHGHPHDFAALDALPGRKFILTNAPRAYAERVLGALGAAHHFDGLIAIEDMTMFGDLRPKPDARMLRWVAARLRVHPSRCVLVEDTLQHQKAAHGLGMATVWMQRWVRGAQRGAWRVQATQDAAKPVTTRPKVGVYLHRKPAYVCARIFSLQQLRRLALP